MKRAAFLSLTTLEVAVLICRSCQSNNLQLILDLGQQPWGNNFVPIDQGTDIPRYPLELYFCRNCAMVQIGYTVPKEMMFVDHNYLSGTTRSLRMHFSEVCERTLKRVEFGPDDYVLDVGGNDGTFLLSFRDKGIRVLNVDSGRKQARISEENGIRCINKFFNKEVADEILSQRGGARVVHGSGIFFHLEELHSAFSGVNKLLRDDGIVVAEFIYLPETVRKNAFDQIYHEHLVYYTIQSFDNLLQRHGLKIYDCEFVPIHGGSCIAYIRHRESAVETEAMRNAVADEVEGSFNRIEVYRTFARCAAKTRDNIVDLVRSLRAEGKVIHALGAPVKGSTTLNYCGLTHEDIACAVEINQLKCNTYYPGTRIPVYHQDEVDPPDVYLLLAWNFKDEILARLEDFRRAGGKILVPFPEPKII